MKTEKMTCLLASTTHICDIQGHREEFLKIMEDSVAYTKVEVRMARYVIPSCTMYIRPRSNNQNAQKFTELIFTMYIYDT